MKQKAFFPPTVALVWISLLAAADGQSQSAPIAGETKINYPRTTEEVAARIIPATLAHPPGDIRRYGAIGNGIADDTKSLQNALNSGANVHIAKPSSKYKTDQLQVPSNVDIFMEPGTVIEANTGYTKHEVVFRIVDKSNVRMSGYGATVQMLKSEYSGEFRHGISIRGSTNVEVEGIASNNSGGDGFYIGEGTLYTFCENITLRDVSADNNRRQGLSIVSGKHIRVIDSRFTNTIGTNPSAGIDIEPNDNTNFIEDIVIENPYTEGNRGPGITIYLNNFPGVTDKTVSVQVVNPVDKQSRVSFLMGQLDLKGYKLDGHIVVTHPVSIDSYLAAFTARNYDAAGPRIDIHDPVAIRPNMSRQTSKKFGSAFAVYRERGDTGAKSVGNVHFYNPEINDDRSIPALVHYFYIRDLTGPDIENVTINDMTIKTGITNAKAMADFVGAGKRNDTKRK